MNERPPPQQNPTMPYFGCAAGSAMPYFATASIIALPIAGVINPIAARPASAVGGSGVGCGNACGLLKARHRRDVRSGVIRVFQRRRIGHRGTRVIVVRGSGLHTHGGKTDPQCSKASSSREDEAHRLLGRRERTASPKAEWPNGCRRQKAEEQTAGKKPKNRRQPNKNCSRGFSLVKSPLFGR